MENPPAEGAPAEAPPAPATEPTTTPSAPPEAAKSPWSRPPPDKARTNLKIAGVVMVLIGALTAWQAYGFASFAGHVFTDAEAEQMASQPGGNVTIDLVGAGEAQVTRSTLNGTVLGTATTDASGHLDMQAERAAVRIEVTWQNHTWVRKAVSFPGFPVQLRLDAATSPATSDGLVQPDISALQWYWIPVAIGVALIVAGVFAFRLRAPRVALAGAALFLLGGVAMAGLAVAALGFSLGALLQPVLFIAMAAFCIWAVRTGWDRFQPVQLGGLRI
ncbi:MAG: hypothetical protein ABR562_00810 [Thermoplasmatota archaeon]